MRIVFFGSSNFVVPILEDIKKSENQTLFQIIQNRNKDLVKFIPGIDEIVNILKTLQSDNSKFSKLINSPLELVGVVTQSNSLNRGKLIQSPIAKWSEENMVSIFQPENINREYEQWEIFTKNNVDVSIVSSFGQIIGKKYLEKGNWINWHPSKLPKYRGPSPLQQAIADGKENTALSWIKVEKAMDAGEIYLQIPIKIDNKNFYELSKETGEIGKLSWPVAVLYSIVGNQSVNLNQSNSEINNLRKISSPIVQNHEIATFTSMLSKQNALVSPLLQTAAEIFNHFKAYIEYPKTYFNSQYFEQKIRLDVVAGVETEVIENTDRREWFRINNKCDYLLLSCKDNTWLKVESITLENGKQVILKGLQF
jgi:methionyl-tRNA formyltransferase